MVWLFHGAFFRALVCKFNPDAMNFDSLDAKSGPKNLQAAMDAAEKFFDVEKFLEPSDIPKLDDKSMLVFLCGSFLDMARIACLSSAHILLARAACAPGRCVFGCRFYAPFFFARPRSSWP